MADIETIRTTPAGNARTLELRLFIGQETFALSVVVPVEGLSGRMA